MGAEAVESLLGLVQSQRPARIRIPQNASVGSRVGDSPLLAQLFSTWRALGSTSESLTLELDSDLPEDLDTFWSSLAGMAALYFSDSVRLAHSDISRFQALSIIAPRVEAMGSGRLGETTTENGVLLCCFSEARNEFLPSLYEFSRMDGIRDELGFRSLLRRIFRHLQPRGSQIVDEGQLDSLSSLLHQLFLNCDQHGSYDLEGRKLKRSLRGLAVRAIDIDHLAAVPLDQSLNHYLAALQLSLTRHGTEQYGRSTMIELSVFDSGPGLALHWLAKAKGAKSYNDFTLAEELNAVQTCFREHTTTKVGALSGQGLPMVFEHLKTLNAYLSIRTGRLSLVQNLASDKPANLYPIHRFPEMGNLAVAAGATYSILFRLE